MAKKAPSKHSRAARRNEPIDINTDKSLKDIKPPPRTAPHNRPSVLAAHHSAGINKKTKRGRQMSAKAKKRQSRAEEMAEAVAERTSTKLKKSLGRAGVVDYRRKGWEKINLDVEGAGDNEDEDDEEESGEDEDMVEEKKAETAVAPAVEDKKPGDGGYLAIDDDGDEEIL